MRIHSFAPALVLALLLTAGCASSGPVITSNDTLSNDFVAAEEGFGRFIDACTLGGCGFSLDPGSRVDTLVVDEATRTIRVEFNEAFAQIPFREHNVRAIRRRIIEALGSGFNGYKLELLALGIPIEELIPNRYRMGSTAIDEQRMPQAPRALRTHVRNLDRPIIPSQGLFGRHIAIWPSHGWYYEATLDRWEWQRARLFQTVEDLLPMSFIVPFLEPMLERAGASVYLPRERDIQHHEVVVDNDGYSRENRSRYVEHTRAERTWFSGIEKGFGGAGDLLYGQTNPFSLGSYRVTHTNTETDADVEWIPEIPERGEYAVYVSYAKLPNATTDARYTVYHLGGSTRFVVDQTMGAGTWTYLGTFLFDAGVHPIGGRVKLENKSVGGRRTLSADAVRFGGGMGNIVRGRAASGRPRFTEGARYYMQYSGMPDTLVYNVTGTLDDYVDDYRGRAEWVNFLRGAPSGPNKDRELSGLGIPIDISLAFHTDAGITKSDSTIGTLMIYSSKGFDDETRFPDGLSRFANRDLGDLMQTQIVDDLRALYDSNWHRRPIWDRDYSEAVRPNVPGVLLELLSHQNFADMKFGLDPRFRFHVARSIYKSILRYLSFQNREPYVVQPLKVSHIVSDLFDDGAVRLTWNPRRDPLETSADPTGYIVYTRRGESAFDNGTFVSDPEYVLTHLETDVVYSFKVTAVNRGGESRASEVVSVGLGYDSRAPILVINGFDRVSGPGTIEQGDWRGFAGLVDEGVPDGRDASFVGEQYDFDIDSPWLDDDAPGHGASHSTAETEVRTGNTHDYAAIHGAAILASGRSFVTASNEAVAERVVDLSRFDLLDIILGEQRTTVGPGNRRGAAFRTFTLRLQAVLETYSAGGGNLFVSGAYVGTDLNGPLSREEDRRFSEDVLRFKWRTDHASQSGLVSAPDDSFLEYGASMSYNTDASGPIYRVESPDAVEPLDESAETLLRYGDNNTSAAVGSRGNSNVVIFGFPFETILTETGRNQLMKSVLSYLENDE
ncbi:MAG: fibronectin type III domain-containing protein [Bacteroidetes bacterium]|nr:fibronectin type III domain-containing protein [Bacteroidota bacterium]